MQLHFFVQRFENIRVEICLIWMQLFFIWINPENATPKYLTQHDAHYIHVIKWYGSIWKQLNKNNRQSSRWPPHTYTADHQFSISQGDKFRKNNNRLAHMLCSNQSIYIFQKALNWMRLNLLFVFSVNHRSAKWISCWFIHQANRARSLPRSSWSNMFSLSHSFDCFYIWLFTMCANQFRDFIA